jgi:hypothetical protein
LKSRFDENEAFAIFSKLQGNEQGELVINIDKEKQDARVSLKIKNSLVPFKQLKVQHFYR